MAFNQMETEFFCLCRVFAGFFDFHGSKLKTVLSHGEDWHMKSVRRFL